MTPRERMAAVMGGRLPDRVPFLPTISTDHACLACGRDFEEALADPALGQECLLGAALRYRADAVRLTIGPPESWYREKKVERVGGRLAQISRDDGRVEGYFDVEGGGKLVPPAGTRPEVSTLAEARKIPVPTAGEYLRRGCLENVRRLAAQAHEKGLFVIGMCSSQTINFMVEKTGRSDTALMLFHDEPALARTLIAKAVAISVEKGRAFAAAGVDCLYIGDSYASASVISPDTYRRFCAGAYRETAREFHRLGVFCYKHCCGNYDPLLEDLAETGVDGMDGIDPESGMSVRRTKERIGRLLTLMGGVSCLSLLNGTPERVEREAAACVLEGREGGRFVLGSACAVPRLAPPENIEAMRRAALAHGSYG